MILKKEKDEGMTIEELVKKSEECGVILSEEMVAQLIRYADLLREWNEKMNLTAITEKEEVFEKHFYDCILPLSVKELSGKVADIGSGAGFPGLVWKIVRPDLKITLVEPTGKRCNFLNAVIQDLGLKEIQVVNERAEEFVIKARSSFQVVTARAVANLRLLSELTLPLVQTTGLFIAMKGSKGHEEAVEAKHATDVLGAVLEKEQDVSLFSGDARVNLFYRKTKKTPAEYPRNYGTMKKKPL